MKRGDPCYRCGGPGPTMDHVFPASLFVPPRPSDLPTVAACRPCQSHTRPDEDYFRDFAAGGSYAHAAAREIWDGPVLRSLDRAPSGRRRLASAIRAVEYRSRGGVYLGSLMGLEGDVDRIGRVLRKMSRGLYYLEMGGLMPADVRWHFEQVSPLHPELPEVAVDLIRALPTREVGTEVRYKFSVYKEQPRASLAWLEFYRRVAFVVSTMPDDGLRSSAVSDA